MKVIFCGGGTAGHVNPALAIAEIIKEKEPDSELLFIGREGGRENAPVEKAGIRLMTIEVSGLRRSFGLKNLKAFLQASKAKRISEKTIKSFSPDIIIGTGGYVCYPVIKAGQKLGLKTVLHESNAISGLATKMLSSRCDRVFLNYKSAAEGLKRKDNISVVGNPIRKDFKLISRQNARRSLGIKPNEIFLVSFGGSLGALRLNNACIKLIKNFSLRKDNIIHLHATGDRFFEECCEEDLKKGKAGCRIVPFINNMPSVLSAADIAITRAGALTVSELAAAKVASILVPSPNVTGDHQTKNAKELSNAGAAITVREDEKLYEELLCSVKALTSDAPSRARLGKRIGGFASFDAAEKIYSELKKLL